MKKNTYPMREHRLVFCLLMMCAGMMGAYTFTMRGGVFCNAQTANIVLMAIAFGKGEWLSGVYYLLPFTAYFVGAIISELLCLVLKDTGLFKWSTYLIGVEMIAMLAIGFVPLDVPHQVVQVIINFLASMQFTAFRKAEGIPMATTFCTNHVRQMGIAVATACKTHSAKPLTRGLYHFEMIAFFFVGGVVLTLCTGVLKEMSIWLSLAPFAILLAMLISGDLYEHKHKDIVVSADDMANAPESKKSTSNM